MNVEYRFSMPSKTPANKVTKKEKKSSKASTARKRRAAENSTGDQTPKCKKNNTVDNRENKHEDGKVLLMPSFSICLREFSGCLIGRIIKQLSISSLKT